MDFICRFQAQILHCAEPDAEIHYGILALVVYGGYAPIGRIRVPFTHRDCCVKKEI